MVMDLSLSSVIIFEGSGGGLNPVCIAIERLISQWGSSSLQVGRDGGGCLDTRSVIPGCLLPRCFLPGSNMSWRLNLVEKGSGFVVMLGSADCLCYVVAFPFPVSDW